MTSKRILAYVLAGGKGTRLHPLTADRAKPALAFAAGHRIVDFVLSNLWNSDIRPVYVLAQYKPHSLIEHLNAVWGLGGASQGCPLEVLLPCRRSHPEGFTGTADAVYQNLRLIERHRPEVVAVFAADHVYRMDVRQMVDFHVRTRADVSVAALPVPLAQASAFGLVAADATGRIHEFQEKPEHPAPIPGRPDRAYASMGNYLFRPEVLIEALEAAHRRGDNDFGRHVLPQLVGSRRTYAYDFAANRVPGVQPHEERGYWRDVGTVDAYRAAQRDVLGPRPRFQLWNPDWPIRGGRDARPGREERRSVVAQLRRVAPAAAAPRMDREERVGAG